MAVEFPDGVGMEQSWHERVPRGVALEVGPAEELFVRPAAKVLHQGARHAGDAYIDAAAEVIGDIGVVTASGGLELVEVSAPGVDKATTLALLCDERGIDAAQVVAFGDARNDIPLLAWAGTGVAMGHAPRGRVARRRPRHRHQRRRRRGRLDRGPPAGLTWSWPARSHTATPTAMVTHGHGQEISARIVLVDPRLVDGGSGKPTRRRAAVSGGQRG